MFFHQKMPDVTMETGGGDVPDIVVERTLALIKPDAVHRAEEIEEIILESGFTILQVSLPKCLH